MWKLLKISEGPPCMTAYRYILDLSIYTFTHTALPTWITVQIDSTIRKYTGHIHWNHKIKKKTFLFITGQLSNHKINVGTCRKHCWFVVFLSVSNNLYFNFKATKSQKRIRNLTAKILSYKYFANTEIFFTSLQHLTAHTLMEIWYMAWSKIIESDIFKVNNVFELWMNKSEIKLLFILLIWELWMVNYSPKGIHFHEICVCLYA